MQSKTKTPQCYFKNKMKSLKRTRVPGELPGERAGHRDRLAGEDAHHMIMDYLNVSVPSSK
jgi:hypothetical protein